MSTSDVPVTEGFIDLDIPNLPKPCQTWYRLHGTLARGGTRPLLVLHGGPGMAHNYMDPLKDLAFAPYNRPVIHYDQLGCGKSTHLPEMKGEAGEKFWTVDLFLLELECIVRTLGIQDSYDVLGNSWGGMLGAEHAIRQPKGLHKLVIADSPADMVEWVDAANRLRKGLPEDVQQTLERCEREGRTNAKEYEEAVKVFYRKHVIRLDPWPEQVIATLTQVEEDPTVYHVMNGPSEFHVVGTMKHWTIKDRLDKIKVSVLLINGWHDEAQDEVVMPLFEGLSKVKWIQFAESAHMPHFEERDKYMKVVDTFLGH